MAVVVGQEAEGREPDGLGQWCKEGQMTRKERMGGCMRARSQLLEVVGVAWGHAGRSQIRG